MQDGIDDLNAGETAESDELDDAHVRGLLADLQDDN